MTTALGRESILLDNLYSLVKYYYYDVWNIYGDPRVTDYAFMDGGPWSTLAMICLYLYLVKYLGPLVMKSRPAYDMRNLILLYNVSLVLVNGWLFYRGSWITNFGLDSWKCQAVDRTSRSEIDLYKIKLGWLFYMTKTIDFCDTFFFVLRKKDRQISALHVFHHSCMPFFCWIGLKFTPGGNNAFFPWLNSGVHTIMYAYYAASTFPTLRPYLWWKRYITQMQMIQFVAVIVHSFYSMLLPGCEWPKMFIYLSIFNAFIFFCMFYSFFQKTYRQGQHHSNGRKCDSSSSPRDAGRQKGLNDAERKPLIRGFNSNLFQVCKPDHVNYYDDVIYYSTDEKPINCNSASERMEDHSHHHDIIHTNSNSSSTTATITTSRALCTDSKCVKCK